MPETITCPLCKGPVELLPDQIRAACAEDHDLSGEEVARQLEEQVERALWSAVKALEDQAAYARWAVAHGRPSASDPETAQKEVDLLRQVLAGHR